MNVKFKFKKIVILILQRRRYFCKVASVVPHITVSSFSVAIPRDFLGTEFRHTNFALN